MADTEERFIARRGAQGEDWRWERAPESRRAGGGARRGFAGAGGWFASAFGALRGLFAPGGAKQRSLAGAETAAAAPERLSGASQDAADTKPALRDALSTAERADRPAGTGSPLLLLAAIGAAATIVVGAIFAIDAIGDGDGNIVGGMTETPKTTLIPAASQTPRPTGTPSPTRIPTPSATPSPTPTVAPATPPSPQGAVAAALWANTAGSWWFGGLSGEVAAYEEGDVVPLMVRWNSVAGQAYTVSISYDCSTGSAVGAIDYLSGVQDWGRDVIYAEHGPAKDQPDGSVPSRDALGFTPDDGNTGRFTLYGGVFRAWPSEPTPGGDCPGKRAVSLPVYATSDRVTVLAGAHLGLSSVHGTGGGAGAATASLSLTATVEGLGTESASIDPSAVADVQN